jgi:hypothetical protein
MRVSAYLAVAAGVVVVAVGALVGPSFLGRSLLCNVVPLCGGDLDGVAAIHNLRWTSTDPSRPSLTLRIPREYMTFYIKPKEKGSTEFITIATYLPDLEPRAKRPHRPCQRSTQKPCDTRADRVNDFDVRLRSDSSMGLHQPSARIGTEYWSKIYPRFKREADKFGFHHYVEHGGSGACIRRDLVDGDTSVRSEFMQLAASSTEKYVCWPHGDELFVSVGSSSVPDAVIRCGALFESVRFGPQCVAEINFNAWRVEYMFPGSELGRWREFDSGTRRLLEQQFGPTR